MVAIWIIILLAFVQGILEWLPVSSEGQLVLILTWLNEPENALSITLFLHLGTMIAVLIRFWKDFSLLFNLRTKVKSVNKNEINDTYKQGERENEKNDKKETASILKIKQRFLWKFLLIGTAITGVIGIPLYFLVKYILQEGQLLEMANGAITGGDVITILIGVFLVGTGFFILISKRKLTEKTLFDMTTKEMIIVGAMQGLAIIPGVSRSGLTVGAMLIEGIKEEDALRGSFLLSVPAVIGANVLVIIIDIIQREISFEGIPIYGMFLAVVIAAIVGLFTIDLFLRLARKINFGYFCIVFGCLALVITIIVIMLNVTTT